MNSTALSKKNLLEKIGFIRFGPGSSAKTGGLRTDLQDYLKRSGKSLVTRPAIDYWFDHASVPSRQKAFQFLYDYVEESIPYTDLSAEQKKVHSQIIALLKRMLSEQNRDQRVHDKKIYLNNNRALIAINTAEADIERLGRTIPGLYLAYRYRFYEDDKKPLTREVLRIFRRQTEIRFEHWYLREATDVDRYEGIILLVGKMLWFLGASARLPERLRIMHFRDIDTVDVRYNDIRWGIASSDIPIPSSPDPASCRICLIRIHEKVADLAEYINKQVTYLEPETLHAEKQGGIIARLIDNRVTALSHPRTINPAHGADGTVMQDKVLRVSQTTIETAGELISDNVDWSKSW